MKKNDNDMRVIILFLAVTFFPFARIGATSVVRCVESDKCGTVWKSGNNHAMRWSILICGLFKRQKSIEALIAKLVNQIVLAKLENAVEIVLFIDSGELTTGYKRQVLVNQSHGEYVSFIDDDDDVSEEYVSKIYRALNRAPDVVALKGIKIVRNQLFYIFFQSTSFTKPFPVGGGLNDTVITLPFDNGELVARWPMAAGLSQIYIVCRYVSHLNPMRRDIALRCPYPDKTLAEDLEQTICLYKSGLLRNEVVINDILYFYHFSTDVL